MADIPVVGQHAIPPDPRMFEALASFGYTLEEAVADLVDNSIDAGAQTVLVRVQVRELKPLTLLVVDDGRGIEPHRMNEVMKVGGIRDYGDSDLGLFGLGLKSASFSQAGRVAVLSRARGRRASGRMWVPEEARKNWLCDEVDSVFVRDELDRDWHHLQLKPSGTIIRWDDVRDFQRADDPDTYVDTVMRRIRKHLGLQLHRFLENGRIRVLLDVHHLDTDVLSPAVEPEPLDPFGYLASGRRGYPRTFPVPSGGDIIPVEAHVWPAHTRDPNYVLGGGRVASRQGFYFYRRDRLVQAGGWNGMRDNEPHFSLARVRIDLRPPYDALFRLTVKKSGVEAPQSFIDALRSTQTEDGADFARYLKDAEATYRKGREKAAAVRTLQPGKGVPARVRQAVQEVADDATGDAVDFVWSELVSGEIFELDRGAKRVLLNRAYRSVLLNGRRGSGTDLPTIKAMLFMLLEPHLRSARVTQGQLQELEALQTILWEAVQAESRA